MKPYLAILSARFRVLLQYRAAAAAGFGCQLFWGLIRMMIFTGFYESSSGAHPMTLQQTITYVWLCQAFIMLIPFRIDYELAEMIRSGNIAYELLRPIDLYAHWYARAVATRIAPTALRATPMLILASLAGWIRWGDPANIVGCAVALCAALLLTSAVTSLLNVTLFWTISGLGIRAMLGGVMFLLSGMIVPLPLLPDWAQPILDALPFRGLIDIPFRLFSGHIPLSELPKQLVTQLSWTVALVMLARWFMARSLRRLVVQGG